MTESSIIGGGCSLIATVFITLLFLTELSHYFTPEYVTNIEVDHGEDGVIQVNFNITLPELSCEYATLEMKNALGDRKRMTNIRTIHKYTLDGTWQGNAAESVHQSMHHYYEGTDKDHYGNKRYAIELTKETFQEVLNDHEVLLVDFHAPWCSHCQRLSPIYEHAAHIVQQKSDSSIDVHNKHSVALATFDCTIKSHTEICRKNHIQAYPTILVFRKSKIKTHRALLGTSLNYESYHGQRNAESISSFTLKVFEEVKSADSDLKYPKSGQGTNSEGDYKLESTVRSKGCRLEGYMMTQKVPTTFVIKADSEHHSFNTSLMSLNHRLHHFSFGNKKPSQVRKLVQSSMEGAYSEQQGRPIILAEGEDEVGFTSPRGEYSHEHYMKIVSFTHIPVKGNKDQAYEYTINSNMHLPDGDSPEVAFKFDISPLKVFVREKPKRLTDEIIKLMALIGGLFSCSVIFEAIFTQAVYSVVKKLD